MLHSGAGSDTSFSKRLDNYASRASKNFNALDNATNSVVLMENDPDFNAGTGSVPRIDGTIQMDAAVAIQDNFGSVIAIENVKNPVLIARDVMLKSPHIMLSGDGAIKFARIMGHSEYNPMTKKAQKLIEKLKNDYKNNNFPEKFKDFYHDTVGAVARVGNEFAAAVSTGGAFPMLRGRVGDSPIPGAGIFVGKKGAVVATGMGEEIAKSILSYKIYSKIGEKGLSDIIKEEIAKFNVSVGIIAIDSENYAYYANKPMAIGIKKF